MRLTGPYISQGERPCSITYTAVQRRRSTRQSSSARKLGSSLFFGQGKVQPSLHRIKGGSFAELVMRLRTASKDERLLVCYEAGYDGFWLARSLAAEGVDCRVLDPASLQVNRRARRVKTDRIDVLMLVRVLIAIDRGDPACLRHRERAEHRGRGCATLPSGTSAIDPRADRPYQPDQGPSLRARRSRRRAVACL